MLTRMLRAAFTTACCPALSPQLLGDGRWDDGDEEAVEGEEEEEEKRLAVTLEMMASSTRGTTTAFHSRASHLRPRAHAGSMTYYFFLKDKLTCGLTDTCLTIACVLFGTTGQDRKCCGPSKASWVPRRDRQALSCCHT